jgi:hypothetical protein
MIKTGIISFLFMAFVLSFSAKAQVKSDIFTKLQSNVPGQGSVHINQDENIKNLISLHVSQQSKFKGIMGYKISIYRGSRQDSQNEAELISANILNKYVGIKPERVYEPPYWKVYVGAFRTKSEALKFLKLLSKDYPDDAFIRPALVQFPD